MIKKVPAAFIYVNWNSTKNINKTKLLLQKLCEFSQVAWKTSKWLNFTILRRKWNLGSESLLKNIPRYVDIANIFFNLFFFSNPTSQLSAEEFMA